MNQFKHLRLAAVLFLLIGVLAACSSQAAQPEATATQAVEAAPASYPYPYPAAPVLTEAVYPAPEIQSDSAMMYPELGDGAEVTWEQAVGLLIAGHVTRASQSHDLTVTLTLKDGRKFKTIEPSIDEILRTIENCGDPCKAIMVATE